MKLGKYEILDKEELRKVFLDYIAALNIPIIDYVAIGIQDTLHKTSTSLMSLLDWQKTFHDLNLAEHDPIRKAVFSTNSKIFAFDEIDFGDSRGKEVMLLRKLHQIENGLVLVRRHLGFNYMLTLGTGYKNFKAYKYFLDNQIAINFIFTDLINLLQPSSKTYQFKNIIHPCGDAK